MTPERSRRSSRLCTVVRDRPRRRASRAAGARASVAQQIDQTLVEFVHAPRCPAFRRKSTAVSALGDWRPAHGGRSPSPAAAKGKSPCCPSSSWEPVISARPSPASSPTAATIRVTVLDRCERSLAALPKHPAIRPRVGDAGSHDALVGCLDGAFAVLSAAPYHQTVKIAEAARVARVHYLDLTEDVASTRVVKALAVRTPRPPSFRNAAWRPASSPSSRPTSRRGSTPCTTCACASAPCRSIRPTL